MKLSTDQCSSGINFGRKLIIFSPRVINSHVFLGPLVQHFLEMVRKYSLQLTHVVLRQRTRTWWTWKTTSSCWRSTRWCSWSWRRRPASSRTFQSQPSQTSQCQSVQVVWEFIHFKLMQIILFPPGRGWGGNGIHSINQDYYFEKLS